MIGAILIPSPWPSPRGRGEFRYSAKHYIVLISPSKGEGGYGLFYYEHLENSD